MYSDVGGGLWIAVPGGRGSSEFAEAAPTGDIAGVRNVFGVFSAPFSVARSSLLYQRPRTRVDESVISLSSGGDQRKVVEARTPAVSPDNSRLAVVVASSLGRHIGVVSVEGGPITRLTFDQDSTDPVWAADGERIAFFHHP